MKRKIAAILAADVAGYSRLVAQDEEDTLARLADYREVFDSFVDRHGGRIFNTAGDSAMCEFDSAVEAVRAAIDIQEALRTRDRTTPDDRKFQYRIGITIGDVVERGTDLLGDSVNIAARLEGLAPPGGICVSRSVHEAVANKIAVTFNDIGLREVKNIPQPVHAFTVGDPDGPARPAKGAGLAQQPAIPAWALAAAAVAVIAAGAAIALWPSAPRQDQPAQTAQATVVPPSGARSDVVISPSPNVIINGVPMGTPGTTASSATVSGEPSASFTRNNAGWSVSLSMPEAATAIYYSLSPEGEFSRTPMLAQNDPRTGRPMPMPAFEMPPDQGDTTIAVKYDDAQGHSKGPFLIPFAPAAAMDTGQKSILEITSNSWLAFNESNPATMYYTHLVAFRCTIKNVMIGYDGAVPDQPLILPPCDRKHPNEIPDDLIPIMTIPATAQNVTAQLTFNDGSRSDIKTFRRP
jgi:class 3 adenylate cyclase